MRTHRGQHNSSFHFAAGVRWLAGAAFCLVALQGCASTQKEDDIAAEPAAPAILRVENRAFLDMTIYVYRNQQRVRLGQVSGSSTSRLTIPAHLIFGSTPLRFQADPIGSNRQSISQEISVSAGDEVTLIIPP